MLKERASALGIKTNIAKDMVSPAGAVDVNFAKIQTPELYLGYAYGAELGNKERFVPKETMSFSLPKDIVPNKVYLQGVWKSNSDNMELISDTGKVVLNYNAKVVNIVAAGDSTLAIKLDNALIDNTSYVKDVHDAKVSVSEERLYSLVFGKEYGEHVIEIDVKGKGFRLYTFTFG